MASTSRDFSAKSNHARTSRFHSTWIEKTLWWITFNSNWIGLITIEQEESLWQAPRGARSRYQITRGFRGRPNSIRIEQEELHSIVIELEELHLVGEATTSRGSRAISNHARFSRTSTPPPHAPGSVSKPEPFKASNPAPASPDKRWRKTYYFSKKSVTF
jgi:hypothetical protein